MSSVRTTVGLSLCFIAVVVGMFVYSVTRTPVLSDEALREMGVFILPQPREIPPFELVSHTGNPFILADLKGRWTFAFFGFTNCPDICPTSMAVLGQANRLIREGSAGDESLFQGVLVSVDPERDDRETLASYVGAFSPDFIGATGELAELGNLSRSVNATFMKVPVRGEGGEVASDRYQVDHTANIVIINPRGHYHGFIKYPAQADTIARAYESLAANF